MPTLTVDFRQLTLTAQGLTVAVEIDGHATDLVIKGLTVDHLADFAAAQVWR